MMKPEDLITPVIYCHCVSTCLCVWSFFWKKKKFMWGETGLQKATIKSANVENFFNLIWTLKCNLCNPRFILSYKIISLTWIKPANSLQLPHEGHGLQVWFQWHHQIRILKATFSWYKTHMLYSLHTALITSINVTF